MKNSPTTPQSEVFQLFDIKFIIHHAGKSSVSIDKYNSAPLTLVQHGPERLVAKEFMCG